MCVVGCARARDYACTCIRLQAWVRARLRAQMSMCGYARACMRFCQNADLYKEVCECTGMHFDVPFKKCEHMHTRVTWTSGPPALQANHSAVVLVPKSLCHCIPLLGVVAPLPRDLLN